MNAYELEMKKWKEEDWEGKLRRMYILAEALNALEFVGVNKSYEKIDTVGYSWMAISYSESINDYIYGKKPLEDVEDQIINDIRNTLDIAVNKYGRLSYVYEIIVSELTNNNGVSNTLIYLKVSLTDEEVRSIEIIQVNNKRQNKDGQ